MNDAGPVEPVEEEPVTDPSAPGWTPPDGNTIHVPDPGQAPIEDHP